MKNRDDVFRISTTYGVVPVHIRNRPIQRWTTMAKPSQEELDSMRRELLRSAEVEVSSRRHPEHPVQEVGTSSPQTAQPCHFRAKGHSATESPGPSAARFKMDGMQRASTTLRGYGWSHQNLRQRVKLEVAAGRQRNSQTVNGQGVY